MRKHYKSALQSHTPYTPPRFERQCLNHSLGFVCHEQSCCKVKGGCTWICSTLCGRRMNESAEEFSFLPFWTSFRSVRISNYAKISEPRRPGGRMRTDRGFAINERNSTHLQSSLCLVCLLINGLFSVSLLSTDQSETNLTPVEMFFWNFSLKFFKTEILGWNPTNGIDPSKNLEIDQTARCYGYELGLIPTVIRHLEVSEWPCLILTIGHSEWLILNMVKLRYGTSWRRHGYSFRGIRNEQRYFMVGRYRGSIDWFIWTLIRGHRWCWLAVVIMAPKNLFYVSQRHNRLFQLMISEDAHRLYIEILCWGKSSANQSPLWMNEWSGIGSSKSRRRRDSKKLYQDFGELSYFIIISDFWCHQTDTNSLSDLRLGQTVPFHFRVLSADTICFLSFVQFAAFAWTTAGWLDWFPFLSCSGLGLGLPTRFLRFFSAVYSPLRSARLICALIRQDGWGKVLLDLFVLRGSLSSLSLSDTIAEASRDYRRLWHAIHPSTAWLVYSLDTAFIYSFIFVLLLLAKHPERPATWFNKSLSLWPGPVIHQKLARSPAIIVAGLVDSKN